MPKKTLDFDPLEKLIATLFKTEEYQFLMHSKNDMIERKPYENMKIAFHGHLTVSTLCQLLPLLSSGAEVTVVLPTELNIDNDVVKALSDAKVTMCPIDEVKNDYDICLDCGAGLKDRIVPRYGAVELTQSGVNKYAAVEDYPIISVDNSKLKKLETLYGTGEGFMNAFLELTKLKKEELTKKKFVIFGFGKVGQGIVRALRLLLADLMQNMEVEQRNLWIKRNIVIVELKKEIEGLQSKYKNYTFVAAEDTKAVQAHLKNSDIVVTATGQKDEISKHYERADFDNCKYFANMGTENEFGPKFSTEELMYDGRPINFSQKIPTPLKFLDPIFYAQNAAIDVLINHKNGIKKLGMGINRLPRKMDFTILQTWNRYYEQDITEIIQGRIIIPALDHCYQIYKIKNSGSDGLLFPNSNSFKFNSNINNNFTTNSTPISKGKEEEEEGQLLPVGSPPTQGIYIGMGT